MHTVRQDYGDNVLLLALDKHDKFGDWWNVARFSPMLSSNWWHAWQWLWGRLCADLAYDTAKQIKEARFTNMPTAWCTRGLKTTTFGKTVEVIVLSDSNPWTARPLWVPCESLVCLPSLHKLVPCVKLASLFEVHQVIVRSSSPYSLIPVSKKVGIYTIYFLIVINLSVVEERRSGVVNRSDPLAYEGRLG